MLLFINGVEITLSHIDSFKYILCYCSSSRQGIPDYLVTNLNTSYVIVHRIQN